MITSYENQIRPKRELNITSRIAELKDPRQQYNIGDREEGQGCWCWELRGNGRTRWPEITEQQEIKTHETSTGHVIQGHVSGLQQSAHKVLAETQQQISDLVRQFENETINLLWGSRNQIKSLFMAIKSIYKTWTYSYCLWGNHQKLIIYATLDACCNNDLLKFTHCSWD